MTARQDYIHAVLSLAQRLLGTAYVLMQPALWGFGRESATYNFSAGSANAIYEPECINKESMF